MAEVDILFAMTGDVYRNARALKQIRALVGYGWRVHVLSLPGDGKTVELPPEVSVDVIRVKHSGGFRFFREIRIAMTRAATGIRAQCYHASDLYVLSAMAEAATANRGRYTYDSRELYPHVASTVGRPWIRWYWSLFEDRYIRGAAVVFTVSKKIAEHIARQYRIRPPVVIRNVPPRRSAPARSGRLSELAGLDPSVPIILHLGQMRHARGCEKLVRSMASVDTAHLVFLGYGPEQDRLLDLTRTLGLSNRISFLDPVPPDEVLEYASGATVGVTLLEDTCLNHRYALPNKLFDYLAAGVPVLAANLPEMRTLVQGYNVGKTVDPGNSAAVAKVLNEMVGSESNRSVWIANAERFCETFNWENASQRFIRAFRFAMVPASTTHLTTRSPG